MAIEEQRLLGVIVHYNPKEGQGFIKDVESHRDIPFYCQYIRSDVLRMKLAQTNRFDEYIFIQPNIYVTYVMCSTVNGDMAGRIEPIETIDPNFDLGAPIIGYIQYFGASHTGAGGMSGWINPNSGGDEQGSSWFDLSKVIDPALKAHLMANTDLKKFEWKEQEIQVRYWRADARRSTPTCTHVALVDDGLRERWIKKYNIGEAELREWGKVCGAYLSIPDNIMMPTYVELTMQSQPLSMKEINILNEFRKEAYNITASNPAQRGQMDHLWEMVEHRQDRELEDSLSKLPNINGTKLAIICRAACHYLAREHAESLEMCYNAQRYDFAAELAMKLEKFDIAQKLAELALYEEPTEKRIQRLGNLSIRTGNALAFCDCFQEMIDACEGGEGGNDEYELFTETAIEMLGTVGIDSELMGARELCRELRKRYARPMPSFRELILELRGSEEKGGDKKVFVIPANRLKAPTYYKSVNAPSAAAAAPTEKTTQQEGAAISNEDFKRHFMVDKRFRIPDQQADHDALPMIDVLLNAELDINAYRMPLFVRLCLDPNGSGSAVQQYIKRLEDFLDKKRKKYDSDRRWRLFMTLLEYAQATDEELRAKAWERARQEAQGDDEPRLLDAMPH